MSGLNRGPAAGRTLVLAGIAVWLTGASPGPAASIVCPSTSPSAQLAAKEIRRYVYLRTGELLPVVESAGGRAIVLKVDDGLAAEQYRLKTDAETLTISGGSEIAVLYGAYEFAEKLGVRFYLHGDVIPDARIDFTLPVLDETHQPLFATRGILPFHDFPEGPDWWNRDDYLAYVTQLAKLRMNILAMHAYPEGLVEPEPLVWIGLPRDADQDGRVTFSYRSNWANTLRTSRWGYAPLRTSEFTGGSARLFPEDAHGPDVMKGLMPRPETPEECDRLFNRTGELLRAVFAHARTLGVKTCVGTEAPLTIPAALMERLKQLGRNFNDIATVRELYAGTFRRIAADHPVDYYWLWTPEVWAWSGNSPEQYEATRRDVLAAHEALQSLGKPFKLVLSGWTLGPQHDRAAFDESLPKEYPMAGLNRSHGHVGVDYAFANLQGRSKWAIPWLENDANMVAYQPWVGRLRHDAADARRVGCDGLLGVHWRTKILAMNAAALAAAAWDQSWLPATFDKDPVWPPRLHPSGPGRPSDHTAARPADADVPEFLGSPRVDLDGYTLPMANGTYALTLAFSETHDAAPGKSMPGLKVQGEPAAARLDRIAAAGGDGRYDLVVPEVNVRDGLLRIEFVRGAELPCLTGIVIGRMSGSADGLAAIPGTRRIRCGEGAVRCYETDRCGGGVDNPAGEARSMPIRDFYADFARAQFGDAVAEDAGAIMASLDGMGSHPGPSGWGSGPGNLSADSGMRAVARERSAVVERFAALRSRVDTAGNRQRFDYWLDTMRASVLMYELGGIRGDLDGVITKINTQSDAAKRPSLGAQALALRLELVRKWEDLMRLQIAVADTPGELGTIANLEQHTRVASAYLTQHDPIIATVLGHALPEAATPSTAYRGEPRLTVTTVRSAVARDERLSLNILALAQRPATSVVVRFRPLGRGGWRTVRAAHLGRAVYRARLPAAKDDFEYRVEATFAGGRRRIWPVTAPELNQTVIVTTNERRIGR